MTQTKKSPSILGGAMIISGTAIGAGMLALPINTAGMWYGWALVAMALTWYCMYQSGLCILEANMHYPVGTNTDTIAKKTLTLPVRVLNGLSLVFVLYTLTYAYITVGSLSLTDQFKSLGFSFGGESMTIYLAIAFVILFGGFVSFSTKAVDRVTTIILGAMVITFLMALPNLLMGVDVHLLLNTGESSPHYASYSFYGIATIVAAFGYHGNVSSLVKYYNKDAKKVQASLFYGTLLAAIIYGLWITAAQGHIPRKLFKTEIIHANDDVVQLKHMLAAKSHFNFINMESLLNWFYNFAIISSFLGVTLGLFDWISDFFRLNNSFFHRMIASLITYLPPTLWALMSPFGFTKAIGYVGFAATIWALIVPAMMMKASRKLYPTAETIFKVKYGNVVFIVIILFGLFVAGSEIAKINGLLPVYG